MFSFSRFVLLWQEMCKGQDFAEENEARASMKGNSKQGASCQARTKYDCLFRMVKWGRWCWTALGL